MSENLDSDTELAIRNAVTQEVSFQWKVIFGAVFASLMGVMGYLSIAVLEWTEWFHPFICIIAAFVIAIGVASTLRGMRYVDRAQKAALEEERQFRAEHPDAYM